MALWQRVTQWLRGGVELPEARSSMPLRDIPLLAVDLELTSLDPQQAKITSIGWAQGQAGSIDLNQCFYSVVRAAGDLAQSPVIHGLIAEDIAQGAHIKEALAQLATFANSHLWVFHNASLDLAVLDKAMAGNGLYLPNIITVDTLKLAVYQLQKQHEVLPPNSATLTMCRQRLNLPLAPAHNALDDALATLQLWFAQYYAMDPNTEMRVQDLMHTQALGCRHLGKVRNKD